MWVSRAWTWRQAILESKLSSATKLTLLVISCHMNDMGHGCYPSMELLARESGLSKRSIVTHINKATQERWLKVTQHGFEGQKWRRNEYEATWPEGGERVAPRKGKGGERNAEGGATDDKKVVKELHSILPLNLPENISGRTNFAQAGNSSAILGQEEATRLLGDLARKLNA